MLKSPLLVFIVAFLAVCLVFQAFKQIVKFVATQTYPAFIRYRQALKTFYLTNLPLLG